MKLNVVHLLVDPLFYSQEEKLIENLSKTKRITEVKALYLTFRYMYIEFDAVWSITETFINLSSIYIIYIYNITELKETTGTDSSLSLS